jgi:ribA/ribD-fused uncharacterized protein
MSIYFYSSKEQYGEFSNFSKHGIELDGKWWPTTEHYFQAQKFNDETYQEKIRTALTPKTAANMGRSREMPIRNDWEAVKDSVMRKAVLKKFQIHKELKELLLATGNEEIVENSPGDYYWGCGADGTGKNMLGKILQEVRQLL